MLAELALVAFLQTTPPPEMVKNPTGLAFTCPDHATDTGHQIDIIREADNVVIQTLDIGDPPLSGTGEVVVSINVQPVAFGQYRFAARAMAGGITSETSAPSPVWERAPGRPLNLTVQGR